MKTPLSKEILTDYLFELLDNSETKQVEQILSHCPESQKLLRQLKITFSQLELVEPVQRYKKTPVLAALTLAAAVVFSFIVLFQTKVQNQVSSVDKPRALNEEALEENRIILLEAYAEKKDDFSLLSRLEAPLKDTIDLKIPEVRIQYDDDNYKIVDLRSYESLNLPSEFASQLNSRTGQTLSLNFN